MPMLQARRQIEYYGIHSIPRETLVHNSEMSRTSPNTGLRDEIVELYFYLIG